MGSHKVICLWDLDSSLPSGYTAGDAVTAIRRLALSSRGGEIRRITAFYNPRSQSARSQSFNGYINELGLHGVTPKDTSFVGGEECTAKCMIVDMLLEMVDASKQPPMLLIISDDPALKYPASLLKNRHRAVEIKSSAEHLEALQKVLNGEGLTIHSGEGSGRVPDTPTSETTVTDQDSFQSHGQSMSLVGELASAPPEVQAVRRHDHRQQRKFRPYNASKQNPNMLTLARSRGPLVTSVAANVHPKYRVLVEVLEEASYEGSPTVDKAKLGNMLAEKSKTLYKEAGAKDFKKYIAMAEGDGIVTVGGGGTGTWVALKGEGDQSSTRSIASAPSLSGYGYYT